MTKVLSHLCRDFQYVRDFGPKMNYDSYWHARFAAEAVTDPRVEEYKYRLIARFIEPGSAVLDIGCGEGGLLAYLRHAKNISAIGLDVSSVSSERARAKGIEVLVADIGRDDIPLPKVDYVILSQVLEHLPAAEEILARLRTQFTKRLLIDIPNTGVLNDRLRLLCGRFPRQWVFHPSEHLRFWTVADFVSMCRQLRYRVEEFHGLYDPYYDIGIPLWRLYPTLFSRYVLYVLRVED